MNGRPPIKVSIDRVIVHGQATPQSEAALRQQLTAGIAVALSQGNDLTVPTSRAHLQIALPQQAGTHNAGRALGQALAAVRPPRGSKP